MPHNSSREKDIIFVLWIWLLFLKQNHPYCQPSHLEWLMWVIIESKWCRHCQLLGVKHWKLAEKLSDDANSNMTKQLELLSLRVGDWVLIYCIAGKFGEFCKSSMICQIITIQTIIMLTINNVLADNINSLNFLLPKVQKESICQTLSLPNFPAIWYFLQDETVQVMETLSSLAWAISNYLSWNDPDITVT